MSSAARALSGATCSATGGATSATCGAGEEEEEEDDAAADPAPAHESKERKATKASAPFIVSSRESRSTNYEVAFWERISSAFEKCDKL